MGGGVWGVGGGTVTQMGDSYQVILPIINRDYSRVFFLPPPPPGDPRVKVTGDPSTLTLSVIFAGHYLGSFLWVSCLGHFVWSLYSVYWITFLSHYLGSFDPFHLCFMHTFLWSRVMTTQVTLGSKWPLTQALWRCRGGGGG